MGLTFVELEIASPAAPAATERLTFLVDSGAIATVVPALVLDRLGIAPLVEQEFRLANGAKIRRRKGVAVFRYRDRVGGGDVLFGEPGDHTVVGALALEALGLCLDPLRRTLEPMPFPLASA